MGLDSLGTILGPLIAYRHALETRSQLVSATGVSEIAQGCWREYSPNESSKVQFLTRNLGAKLASISHCHRDPEKANAIDPALVHLALSMRPGAVDHRHG